MKNKCELTAFTHEDDKGWFSAVLTMGGLNQDCAEKMAIIMQEVVQEFLTNKDYPPKIPATKIN